ncbi:SLMAP family protein [Megaselia abdita]
MDSIYLDDPEIKLPFIILNADSNSHPFAPRKIYIQELNEIKVGRSIAKNKVSGNNAIFDCKVLSRNHAVFWYSEKDNKFFIKDTKSSNGTFVNDKKLSAMQFEEIYSGDILKFGVDVVESTKKDGTVHGCIIASVHLFDANGIEISSKRVSIKSKDVFSECDINKVRTLMQETTNRDSFVKSKLYDIQNIMDLTRNSALNCWQALIDEDKLLNKIDLLENKLSYFQKHYTENNLKVDIMKLQDEKLNYNNSAKKILQKANQEKIVAMNKLLEIEKKYTKTESNCCILREKNNESQKCFQELQAKFNRLEADFNLQQSKFDILLSRNDELEAMINESNKDLSNVEKSKECGDFDRNIHLVENGYNMNLVRIENNNETVMTSQAFQLMQEKLLYIESQMEKLKSEKDFLNFFYIQSIDPSFETSKNTITIDPFNNIDPETDEIIRQEEELIVFKTKCDELMKENRKLKLEMSNSRTMGKDKINKYLTIFISLLLILFAYFYNIS